MIKNLLAFEDNATFVMENGITVSIGTGPKNYCNRRHLGGVDATSMEVCIFDQNGKAVVDEESGKSVLNNGVAGWVSVALLPSILESVAEKDWMKLRDLVAL